VETKSVAGGLVQLPERVLMLEAITRDLVSPSA
jgi:hypothetical protein